MASARIRTTSSLSSTKQLKSMGRPRRRASLSAMYNADSSSAALGGAETLAASRAASLANIANLRRRASSANASRGVSMSATDSPSLSKSESMSWLVWPANAPEAARNRRGQAASQNSSSSRRAQAGRLVLAARGWPWSLWPWSLCSLRPSTLSL